MRRGWQIACSPTHLPSRFEIDDAVEHQVAQALAAACNFPPTHPDKGAPSQPACTLPRAFHVNPSTRHLFFFDKIRRRHLAQEPTSRWLATSHARALQANFADAAFGVNGDERNPVARNGGACDVTNTHVLVFQRRGWHGRLCRAFVAAHTLSGL